MKPTTGKPELMKQMNRALIYRALIALRTVTRAEIATQTKLSVTTVRSLLDELTQENAVVALALDESSGGRRAQRYALNGRQNLLLALYFEHDRIRYQISDLLGNELEAGERPALGEDAAVAVEALFASLEMRGAIRAVGLGVPGIVENGRYYLSDTQSAWLVSSIGEQLEQELKLPVLLENDLNAVAVGFALRRAQNLPAGDASGLDMVYIHFNYGCSGAGVVADGRIVRGGSRFAGELGHLPMGDGKTLNEALSAAATPDGQLEVICRAIATVNCVTNPALVVLGGDRFADGAFSAEQITARLKTQIPDPLCPAIDICTDCGADYLAGLTHLTTEVLLPTLPL